METFFVWSVPIVRVETVAVGWPAVVTFATLPVPLMVIVSPVIVPVWPPETFRDVILSSAVTFCVTSAEEPSSVKS